MRRRKFFAAVAGASTLAGCLDEADPSNDSQLTTEQPEQNEPTATPVPPEVSWSETLLNGTKYAVTATVDMGGFDAVLIKTMGGEQVAEISSSGNHKIAGEGTDYGTAEAGTVFSATAVPHALGTHTVGSQEQPSFPIFLDGLSGYTYPNQESEETYARKFEQSAHGQETVFTTEIPSNFYNYYQDRLRIPDYGAYVADRYDDSHISGIASSLESFGDDNDLTARQIVDHAVAVVQGMEYTQDKAGTGYNEYPKYPIETLVDRGGDCEDTCILLASLLRELGYGVVLLLMPDANHMALGVAGEESIDGTYYEKDDTRYYYLETTGEGWQVGEVPENIQNTQAELVQVREYPVLAFSYSVSVSSEGGVDAEIQVGNVGTSMANNGAVQMEFHDEGENVVASERSNLGSLAPEEQTTVSMNLTPPDDRALRARVGVLLSGDAHDVTTSDYRSPN